MMQEYTIFVDSNRICFKQFVNEIEHKRVEVLPKSAVEIVFDVKNDGIDAVFFASNPTAIFESFCKQLHMQEAGGGLVLNSQKQVLMIYRRGKWDLPKGKLDDGETIEECAVREVQEETGLQHIGLESFLLNTYHIYTHLTKLVLKKTHWYLMHTHDNNVQPQAEEDITEVRFVDAQKLNVLLENSFENIRLVCACIK
jgi:8-oxo-dGTP pyrophosphatase MutT (NUDIX family)